MMENKLKFKDHINFVKTNIFRSVGILEKLKNCLDLTSLHKLYYTLIYSHINYGLIIWGTPIRHMRQDLKYYKIRQLGLYTILAGIPPQLYYIKKVKYYLYHNLNNSK